MQPQKALQIFNRGQYLLIRIVIYTLETENKKTDRPNIFFTILMFIIKYVSVQLSLMFASKAYKYIHTSGAHFRYSVYDSSLSVSEIWFYNDDTSFIRCGMHSCSFRGSTSISISFAFATTVGVDGVVLSSLTLFSSWVRLERVVTLSWKSKEVMS
jgi:hypothetical protein